MVSLLNRINNQFTNDSWRKMRLLILSALFAGLWLGAGFQLITASLVSFAVYLLTGGWSFVRIVFATLPRDLKALYVLLSIKRQLKKHQAARDGIPTIFSKVCDANRNKVCFIDVIGDRQWTFQEVDEYANRVANYFASEGVKPGDSVGVFMESCAQFVCISIGLSKIGVVPALLNFNLKGQALAHCSEAANATCIIYSGGLAAVVEEAKKHISRKMIYYSINSPSNDDIPLENVLRNIDSKRPPSIPYDFNGPYLYIYTSGTTGLPKAAKVVHSRYYYMASTIAMFSDLTPSDIIYDTLPLYHTAGGVLGIGQALIHGRTVVIRQKFSARNFWSDCIKYNCTVAQYIGEICRFLLAQPKKDDDRDHKVRVIFGNGLRPQIWTEFKDRFGIEKITEFYGATEGNASAVNSNNKVGCVGFTSVIAPTMHPISVILVDKTSGKPLRGPDGLCIRAPPGEPGELIGKINNSDPLKRFDGYSTKAATEKKIARDVFSKGDMYFLTGDILEMDEFGYLYFKDRTGDTFRWKGENVSTAEVEATISNIIDKRDAVVYGVEIPGVEGRAGMVAIEDPDEVVDLNKLYHHLLLELPPYARPIFVRLLKQAEKTSTFKLMKVKIRDEGYDLSKIVDKLYYLDTKGACYRPLTQESYDDIINGRLRF